jgi:hypothetical protein
VGVNEEASAVGAAQEFLCAASLPFIPSSQNRHCWEQLRASLRRKENLFKSFGGPTSHLSTRYGKQNFGEGQGYPLTQNLAHHMLWAGSYLPVYIRILTANSPSIERHVNFAEILPKVLDKQNISW